MTTTAEFVLQRALARGWLTSAQVEHAQAARAPAAHDADVCWPVQAGLLSEDEVVDLLAEEFVLPRVDVGSVRPTPDALRCLPAGLAHEHRVLPLSLDGGALRIAVADPLAGGAMESLEQATGHALLLALAPPSALAGAIRRWYDQVPASAPVLEGAVADAPRTATDDDEPVVRYVQQLVEEAVERRASDIHLEPLPGRLRRRYRIDGALHELSDVPPSFRRAVVARLKVLADLSLAEKRLPQDGRIWMTTGGRRCDLRVSSLPTVHGESLVLRLLDQQDIQLGLGELGLESDDRTTLERLLASPDGLVLVTGPTGSGKTTTLYSCLHHLNQPDRKIITVEDPIEYQLRGVTQVPVRAEVGMTFVAALRAMLRQAPNVVMVGEVRDRETADAAMQAALTGHLVFSTLHTNDAVGAVPRLVDLGVPPLVVATATRAVVAQRLVRRVCPACATPAPGDEPAWRHLGGSPRDLPFAGRRGRGCPQCHGSGYHGRTGIFEILVLTEALQQVISHGAGSRELRQASGAAALRTLREDGLRKVARGVTTLEEIVNVTTDPVV